MDFKEIGEDSIFASDEQQKEVECTADEDSCRLIQREREGALEGGKRLGHVAGAENAGGSERSHLRENSNNAALAATCELVSGDAAAESEGGGAGWLGSRCAISAGMASLAD
jgi:hypothetical protein